MFQKEKLGIPQPTFRNVPGVIYLDSTINTVDEQLVEVLKRVLSHLQVAKLLLKTNGNHDEFNHFAGSALNRRIHPLIWPSTLSVIY